MGGGNAPDARDPAADYGRGIDIYLSKLDDLLNAEQSARTQYDPARLQEQLDYQKQYGGQFDQAALDRLNTIDPQSQQIRSKLGDLVLGDLQNGYALPADLDREITHDIRGSQAARGNILGQGAATAEASIKGKTAFDMYNRRLANAGTFLSGPTTAQQIYQLPTPTPDRSAGYTVGGFQAGPQGVAFGQQAFSNQLAANQANGNPWSQALGGAATGAAAGSAFGPWGTVIGGVAGAAGGYFASDARLKENVTDTGLRHRGVRIVDFNFKGSAERIRGVIADELKEVMPWLVKEVDGWKYVNYNGFGLQMRRVN